MTQEQPNLKLNKQEQPELKIPCEVYSRVVGYLRPIQNWNDGKQQEFADRQVFRVPDEDAN